MTKDSNLEKTESLSSIIDQIRALTSKTQGVLDNADVISLRRMNPEKPGTAFFKLYNILFATDDYKLSFDILKIDTETKWATIFQSMALLGDLYIPSNRFGQSLIDIDYSEHRFSRLLRGDTFFLIDELPRIAKTFRAKNIGTSWISPASLLLSAGKENEEKVRRRIAHEYYGSI